MGEYRVASGGGTETGERATSMASGILDTLRVTVLGDGGPTVVLAHGFGTDQAAWRHQVAALSGRARLVLFDHLGCGAGAAGYSPRRHDSLERYAEDLIELHEALGLRRALFVGHSAGAMIGLLASVTRPELYRRLVLLGASPRYLDDAGYRGGFARADVDALYEGMARDYLGWANGFAPVVAGNAERPSLAQEFARSLGGLRPDVAQSVARVIFESDHRDLLASVTVPSIVLQTRRDNAVPVEVGEHLVRHLPGSRLVLIDAEGHLPHLSSPGAVNAVLHQVLDDWD